MGSSGWILYWSGLYISDIFIYAASLIFRN